MVVNKILFTDMHVFADPEERTPFHVGRLELNPP